MRRRSLLLAPAALLGGADRLPAAAVPISRMSTPWWRARHLAKLEELRRGPVDLIWLGDSITQDWELRGPPAWRDFQPIWQQFYGDRRAVNLGFKGDATSHLLWRMQNGELDGYRPKAAVILIGANNFGRVHWTAGETLAGIEAVVADLQRRQPATKIIVLGVLPSIRSAWVTQQTFALNRAMAERYPTGGTVTFMDLSPLFMRDGVVERSQFLDDQLTPPDPPLHPTAQAQAQLAAAIEPTLATMLGDRRHQV